MLDGVIDRQSLTGFRPGAYLLAAVNRRQHRRAPVVAQACVPFLAQLIPLKGVALLFAGFRPEFSLAVGIGDAPLRGHLFDQRRPPRKSPQDVLRDAGNLEIVAFALDAEADVLKPVRQPHAECRLEIRRITLQFSELASFPATFRFVISRIEHKTVGMKLRIGDAINGPGSGVDEFRPDHVAGNTVFILALYADAGFHLRFHLSHRLIDGATERRQYVLVAAHGIQQRHRLRHREREIVPHPPPDARLHRQGFSIIPWI